MQIVVVIIQTIDSAIEFAEHGTGTCVSGRTDERLNIIRTVGESYADDENETERKGRTIGEPFTQTGEQGRGDGGLDFVGHGRKIKK
jgi:hypothetical protein